MTRFEYFQICTFYDLALSETSKSIYRLSDRIGDWFQKSTKKTIVYTCYYGIFATCYLYNFRKRMWFHTQTAFNLCSLKENFWLKKTYFSLITYNRTNIALEKKYMSIYTDTKMRRYTYFENADLAKFKRSVTHFFHSRWM